MNLVETRDLAIGYGDKILVNNINFRLQEKQICCLLGANGAGKSTFLKTLLGLQAPLQGEVYWRQRPLSDYSQGELACNIAYVPQAHQHLFPFLVQDMVLMGRSAYLKWYQSPKAEDRDLALSALAGLQIEHLAKRYYHQLSGGRETVGADCPRHCATGNIIDHGRTHREPGFRQSNSCVGKNKTPANAKYRLIDHHT
nr:ABC transporter ATP-binding protein [Aggregatibacter actinomycetemcomitans]